MIRKILLLLLLQGACWLAASAGNVSTKEALKKASAFVNARTRAAKGDAPRTAEKVVKLEYAAPENSFYVFNVGTSDGFVIVSGNDQTDAILGYTDRGRFEYNAMPDNMKWWLHGYALQLQGDMPRNVPTRAGSAGTQAKEEVKPLVETEWDQLSPYNGQCPKQYPTRS